MGRHVEVSLYEGKRLLRRKSLDTGIHVLKNNGIYLKVQLKWFKVIPELRIEEQKIELKKLKRKELGILLSEQNIHNELNPRKSPKKPFNYGKLKIAVVLIVIGVLWTIMIKDKGKFWSIPSTLIFIIAFFQISSPLIEKVPERFMDSETKGKFKLILGIAGMIATQIIIGKLIL